MSNIYYIYSYIRSDGTPYYIGKGMGDRAFKNHKKIPVPKDKSRIIIMESGLTEIGAFALERRYIRWYGRKNNGTGILRNMTDGGEGSSGAILSEDHKRKISKSLLGNKNPMYGNSPMLGKKHSEETKQKIKKSLQGKTNPNFGKIPWNKGISFLSEDAKRKISDKLKGTKRSEETKSKMSRAKKQYWETIKKTRAPTVLSG